MPFSTVCCFYGYIYLHMLGTMAEVPRDGAKTSLSIRKTAFAVLGFCFSTEALERVLALIKTGNLTPWECALSQIKTL